MRLHMLHDKDGRAEVSRQHRKELGKRNGTARRNTHKDDRRTGPASRPGRRRNRLLLDTGDGNWQGRRSRSFWVENRTNLSLARERLDHGPEAVAKPCQIFFLRPSLGFGDEVERSRLKRSNGHLSAPDRAGTEHNDTRVRT